MKIICVLLASLLVSSCMVVGPATWATGKVASTTVGLAGKAAGAGYKALTKSKKNEEAEKTED